LCKTSRWAVFVNSHLPPKKQKVKKVKTWLYLPVAVENFSGLLWSLMSNKLFIEHTHCTLREEKYLL
jgi:hypothetical protein